MARARELARSGRPVLVNVWLDKTEFRDELNVSLYGGHLDFDVMVSESKTGPFTRIGYLEFTESVTSDSCDHRLHFHHPKFR